MIGIGMKMRFIFVIGVRSVRMSVLMKCKEDKEAI